MDLDAFTVTVHGRRVCVGGELDMAGGAVLKRVVAELGDDVTIDLAAVTFVDSAGLHALVRASDRSARSTVVGVSPAVHRLLDLTGLAGLIAHIER